MSNTFNLERHIFQSPKFRSIVEDAVAFFNGTPIHPLPPPGMFGGTGVYALYYSGSFEAYARLSAVTQEEFANPIYVGKAVPSGWRAARTVHTDSSALYRRLREHQRSIEQTRNLEIDEFHCRFMILREVEGDLIVPVEAELIRLHRPLWNTAIDGFGNHDPGSGRYDQAPSEWDTLHPGRVWADRLRGVPPDLHDILRKIDHHLSTSAS